MTIEALFRGLFDTEFVSVIGVGEFLLCLFVSLFIGAIMGACYTYRTQYTKTFLVTLILLPAAVCAVIMMVNGNIGAGLAVAGSFALVRFRSLPGTAKEVSGVFLCVSIGLACGMGYVGVAVLFFVMMSIFIIILEKSNFGHGSLAQRHLKITIPEDLDYDELFDDLLEKYTVRWELIRVHTTNMGTLYELTYEVLMRRQSQSREFIDALRCRNGNLSISLGRAVDKESM